MMTERRPSGSGWVQVRSPITGPTASAWEYGRILVTSELATMEMPDGNDSGPTWLVSVSRHGKRPSASDVRKARRAFGMRDAEIDNHHPGVAVHLFLVVNPARRVDCECKSDEAVIVDADGYAWTTPTDGPCRGCEYERLTAGAKACPIHAAAGQVQHG